MNVVSPSSVVCGIVEIAKSSFDEDTLAAFMKRIICTGVLYLFALAQIVQYITKKYYMYIYIRCIYFALAHTVQCINKKQYMYIYIYIYISLTVCDSLLTLHLK